MGIADCELHVSPDAGWQELPSIEIRAIGPLAGGSISMLLCAERGYRHDAVSVPFQLRARGSIYNLELGMNIAAFQHLGGDAKLDDILTMLAADEGRLLLRLEKTNVRIKQPAPLRRDARRTGNGDA